jgi:hypothetical protein
MQIGVGGHPEGNPDDPFMIMGSALDQPFWPGPVPKDRREDVQLWTALASLANSGMSRHPLGIRIGEDPPDRYLVHKGREWATEMTELTVQDVRRELSPVRQFGRDLQERLNARPADFNHLNGRLVSLSKLGPVEIPKDTSQLLSDLETVLEADNGFVGQGLDLSQGPPQNLGTRGFYGDHGPFNVMVQNGTNTSGITVSASSSSQVLRSEAIKALGDRVAAKDIAENEILLVTCGLIDPKGYICPADSSIFQLLQDAATAGISVLPQKPTHIKGILIHLWNSPLLVHWECGNDVPWLI